MSYEDLVINGFNFNQLLISSIEILKITALEKCIHADEMLVQVYNDILKLNSNSTKFESNLNRLLQAKEKNEALIANYPLKKEIDSLY